MVGIICLWVALVNCGPVFDEIGCVLNQAKALIGIREQGGNNRGPMVDKIIKESGGKPGQPWCSYTMIYIHKQCGIKFKGVNGMAMSWAKPDKKVQETKSVRASDLFTTYSKQLGRIGHVGMVYTVYPEESFFQSFEGNVNFRGDRESRGSGAKCLIREYKNIYGFYRWLK